MIVDVLRVVVIDDHTLFRDGLEGLLRHRNINVLASVGNAREGIEVARQLKPEIVLLDLRMPDTNGLDVLKQLTEEGSDLAVVILTTSNNENDLADALAQGARGYLLKDMDPDDLVAALRNINNGGIVVAPALQHIFHQIQGGCDTDSMKPLARLTPREKEILVFLADGHSNKSIANALDISDGTVKLHVKQILRKLDVRSRVEAAIIAVECGVRGHRKD